MELCDITKLLTCANEETTEVVKTLQNKYNCSQEKIYWNFRAVFGKKLRDARWDYREPSPEEFKKNILLSNSKEDLRKIYKTLSNSQWVGVYDRVLGVSTFAKARELAMLSVAPRVYSPQIDNNKAMWAACRLGDGSYDKKRNAWRIEHCHWQKGWLERKVEMFVKAFPYMSDKISHNETRNTYSWYSLKTEATEFKRLGTCPKHEVIPALNAFGIWYLFLDDGCYYRRSQQLVNFAVENMEIATRLIQQISNLGGPTFRVANKNCITLTGTHNVQNFFKLFLEPFAELTPDCMKYKVTYKPID